MATMITLRAQAGYGYGGKQYIARITGRNSKFTFEREFIGKKGGKRGESSSVDVDDPGLYEARTVDGKGRTMDQYYLIEKKGDDGQLDEFAVTKEDAMKLAKLMDQMDFESAVLKVWPPKPAEAS